MAKGNTLILVVAVVALVGGGYYYFYEIKPKQEIQKRTQKIVDRIQDTGKIRNRAELELAINAAQGDFKPFESSHARSFRASKSNKARSGSIY